MSSDLCMVYLAKSKRCHLNEIDLDRNILFFN